MRGGLSTHWQGSTPPRAVASHAARPDPLFTARVGDIWKFLTTQPASFWLICAYLFFEYVRPQSIYPSLDVLPWGMTLLILCMVACILEGKAFRLKTPAGPLLILFTVIVLASSVQAYSPSASYAMLELFLSWVLIYILITNVVTTEQRFFIFALSFLLYSFKMSQHGARSWMMNGFGFSSWGVTGAPGWFHNSGEVGIQMCVFFPLALAFYIGLKDRWSKWRKLFFVLLPVTAVMTMIASSSRGALVGGALVLAWIVLRSRQRVKAGIAAIVVTFAVIFFVPEEQKQRFSTMGEDKTSQSRFTVWEYGIEMANDYPLLGIGYKNWPVYTPRHYGTGLLPHNIFVEAGAELGYTGLIGFLLLIGAVFVINARTRRIARSLPGDNRFLYQMAHGLDGGLIGFIGSGFFVTVLYYPYFWIQLAMTVALHAAAMNKARALSRASSTEVVPGQVIPAAPMPVNGSRPRTASGRVFLGQRGGAVLGSHGTGT